jgi:hypothetical protein
MAQCAYCKTETYMYEGDVTICIKCSDAREANREPATSEHQIRSAMHLGEIPNGMPPRMLLSASTMPRAKYLSRAAK